MTPAPNGINFFLNRYSAILQVLSDAAIALLASVRCAANSWIANLVTVDPVTQQQRLSVACKQVAKMLMPFGAGPVSSLQNPFLPGRCQGFPARVNQPLTQQKLDTVRLSAQRGKPLGDKRWVESIAKRLYLESTLRPRGRPRVRFPKEETIKEAWPWRSPPGRKPCLHSWSKQSW